MTAATIQPTVASLIRGDSAALVAEAASALVARLCGDGDPAPVVEDHRGDEADADGLATACSTLPLFSARRVVVVRDAGGLRAEAAAVLVDWLADPLPGVSLVLVAGGGTIAPRLVAAVKKAGEVVDVSPGTGKARSRWFASRLDEAPVRLDPPAAEALRQNTGEDVGRLTGVLEALAAAYGEGARVGREDLLPFLGEAGDVAPWELTDALDSGDTEAALRALRRMVGAGQRHPLVVLAVLHRHYASMLRLDGGGVSSEGEAAALLGGRSPFVAAKLLAQSRRLGSEGVGRAVTLLADADADLRGTTGWPAELVMEVLVGRLSRLGGRRRTASRR